MKAERQADNLQMDWGLAEQVGGYVPPDLSDRVIARWREGEPVDEPSMSVTTTERSRGWLAAAVLLLGLGVVVGAALLQHRTRTAQDAPAMETDAEQVPASTEAWQVVSTRAQIEALPDDTRFIEGRNIGDDDVSALLRLSRLEGLKLLARTYTDDFTLKEPLLYPPLRLLSPAAVPTLAKLSGLRILHLDFQEELSGHKLDFLRDLPLLQELGLQRMDTDDATLAVIERMPSLRTLDLTANEGFGAEGVAAIASCPGIRSLKLSGCHPLTAAMLEPIGEMRQLEELSMDSIANGTRAPFWGRNTPEVIARKAEQYRKWAANGTGLTDAALAVLRGKPKLRRLAIGSTRITDDGLRVLAELPLLADLSLNHSPLLTADAIARLPITLRRLDVSGCGFGDEEIAAVRKRLTSLREVSLAGCDKVTDVSSTELRELSGLRKLDLSDCPKVTENCLSLLGSASQLREVSLGNASWMTLARAESLFESGKKLVCWKRDDAAFNAGMRALATKYEAFLSQKQYETVKSLADIEALPAEVTHVWLRGLGDDAAAALSRRPNLVGLQFVGSEGQVPLTNAGFAAIARLEKLERLHLIGAKDVGGSGLGQLQALPVLKSLFLHDMPLDDEALQVLPKLPALQELGLGGTRSFGDRGMTAIAACKGLKLLSLRGCSQLQPESIARLGSLTKLETLALTEAGGLDDRALMGLRTLTSMRALLLAKGSFTGDGMRALGGMRQLQSLVLENNAQLASSSMLQVPTTIRELSLDGCSGMDPSAAKHLRDRFPGLGGLSVVKCDWVNDDALAAILQLPKLEWLRLTGCQSPTAKSFEAIRANRSLRKLEVSQCPWFGDEMQQRLKTERPELQVTR
ncbi:MAG TPA: hypothetical protein VK348_08505 [Planctomycetota bacterium]|nr:hypothetical protein [Planctomycetota bacterium]